MASAGVEILGMVLAVAGWLGVMVACCLPMWRVVAYLGQNIVMAHIIWEGLWMSCSVQSTGQMHCRIYDSMLGLPHDLQAARALVVTALMTGVVGISLAVAGAKCTNCTRAAESKPRLALGSGVAFVVSGLLVLVAVCWTANVIVLDFHNPLLEETQKREFGNSLYFGWAASCLLLLGGALLSCSCSCGGGDRGGGLGEGGGGARGGGGGGRGDGMGSGGTSGASVPFSAPHHHHHHHPPSSSRGYSGYSHTRYTPVKTPPDRRDYV